MGDLKPLSVGRSVGAPASEPATAFARLSAATGAPRFALLRVEMIVFLLLIATFAAIIFKGTIIDRHMSVNLVTVGRYTRYWYSDKNDGGNSSDSHNHNDILAWSCELRPGVTNPYCGSGVIFDTAANGTGFDFTKFQKVTVDLDYHGPSRQLRLVIKNADRRYTDAHGVGNDKPHSISFAVVPGHNHLELNLADAAVEQWWAYAHRQVRDAEVPQLDNVIALDVTTGDSKLGHHDFRLHEISAGGAAVSAEHWYLILLGGWTGIAALFLGWRILRMRRIYAENQEILLAESRILEESRDAAESASQAKSRFLAHMSHELRTPLNAILGYAQILRMIGQSERQISAARTIQQSGEHLLSLITDILDLSRIEAGKLELAPRPIDLRLLVRNVTDMIAVRADEKDLAFHWTIAPDVPRGIVADDKCLRQVLINLLSNAVKFTDRGEVRLQVSLLSSGGGDVQLRFDVRDTGRGIAAEYLQCVFEPFEQAGDQARRFGGTGLGLSISRRLIELMDGAMQVESTLGVGSRFWFEVSLPLADHGALPSAAGDTESGSGGSGLRAPRACFDAVPVGATMDRLHEMAQAGSMRAIRREAERLIREEPAVRPFAEELLTLAKSYQSQALLELIEKHKIESVPV